MKIWRSYPPIPLATLFCTAFSLATLFFLSFPAVTANAFLHLEQPGHLEQPDPITMSGTISATTAISSPDPPTFGTIQPVSIEEQRLVSIREGIDLAASPQQPYSLTLKATVGLNPHKCAEQPLLNVPKDTLVVTCYFITNSGSESIDFHTVDDSKFGSIVSNEPFSLGPGVSALITTSNRLSETTAHMGTWYGLDESGSLLTSAAAKAKSYVDGLWVEPGVRQPNGDCLPMNTLPVPTNTSAELCYRLVNQTDLTLSQHTLTASGVGELASALDYPLAPGESVTIQELGLSITELITTTKTYSLTWRATTTDSPPELPEDRFSDPIPLTGVGQLEAQVPNLTGRLTVGLERDTCADTQEISVFAGTEIVFCYTVSNVGGVTFTHHTITDSFQLPESFSDSSRGDSEKKSSRVVREREEFTMAPAVVGEFTEAQTAQASSVVTMTWVAYSANPLSGTVTSSDADATHTADATRTADATAATGAAVHAPSTLEFPLRFVSSTATSHVTITVLPLSDVSITIYEDLNQNGEKDKDEAGIPDATVQLTNEPDAPFIIMTEPDGTARFANLPPAVYDISVGFEQTPYLFDATLGGNINSLFLRSGGNDSASLGFIRTGRRPQNVYVPIQVQAR